MAEPGRPTTYTDDLAIEIVALVAEGKSMRSIVKEPNMPAMSTVFKWLKEHEDFSEQYTRAKVEAADALADDIQEIAEGVLKKTYDPHAARVAVDAKKWIASKLKPKVYGDKLDLSGEQTINHKFKELDDDQLDAAVAAAKDSLT